MTTMQTETSEPKKSIEDYKKILKLSKNNFTPEGILKSFEITHWVRKENGELDEIGPEIDAKNKLIQHLISEQMKARRYFEIESPYKNSCIACHGTGEIYKFERKTVVVKCHICGGKGHIKIKCPTCNGSGRDLESWKHDGIINKPCKKCSAKKTIYIKCEKCRGKGEKKKLVTSHMIKSTTPCKHCNQLGFISNNIVVKQKMKKPTIKKQLCNPVLSSDLAAKIQQSFDIK